MLLWQLILLIVVQTLILVAVAVVAIRYLLLRERRLRRLFYDRYHRDRLSDQIDSLLERWERELGVTLTWGARQMILIPIEELAEEDEIRDLAEINQSIREILLTLREEPDPRDEKDRYKSSVSVIKAFARRFCNIPPFCSRIDERSR